MSAMIRVIDSSQVASLLDIRPLVTIVGQALIKQGRGEAVRPERPHFPVGEGLGTGGSEKALGTGLTMPAYITGSDYYVTKLVGLFEANPTRDLPVINAQILVNEADTGLPVAVIDGTRITAMRTGCIGGLAARELAAQPVDLCVIGAGTQARWQTRAIAAVTDLDRVRVYSPSESRIACAEELDQDLDASVTPVESAQAAVEGANTVVTATPAEEPVLDGEWLAQGTLVVAVGAYSAEMQELDPTTFDRASQVFADVPAEVAETGDLLATPLDSDDLDPLSNVIEGTNGRTRDTDIVVVESVGSAVFDAAVATHTVERAEQDGVGTIVEL